MILVLSRVWEDARVFLRRTTNYLRGLFFQSTECPILLLILHSSQGAGRLASAVANDSVFVELVDEQQFSTSIVFLISNITFIILHLQFGYFQF